MASKKSRKIKWELVGINTLVLLFVIMLLSYTFVHTGAVLARYIEPYFLGYVAAFGIEGLVVVLSWRRTFKSGSSKSIDITLAIVLTISAVANIYEGYAVKNKQEMILANIASIDIIQGVVGFLVTATIPLLVFMSGEVMGKWIEGLGKIVADLEAHANAEPALESTQSKIEPAQSKTEQMHSVFLCQQCEKEFATVQALNAHKRFCANAEPALSQNGHSK